METNYLEVGKETHCLRCHFNIPRDEFVAHFDLHNKNTQPIFCKDLDYLLNCPDWARDFKG